MRQFGLMALAMAALIAPVAAQADSDAQAWLTFAGDIKVADNSAITADFILRSRSNSVDVSQSIGRIGVRQTLTPGWSVQLTYGLVDSFVDGGTDRYEHRLGQTLAFPITTIGSVRIDGRGGLEQRIQPSGGAWGWRARGRLRAVYPLSEKASLQLSEEVIGSLNDTAWGQRSGLTATRTTAAIRFKLADNIGVSPGYNWQHVFRLGQDFDSHITALTFDAHF